MLSLLTGLMAGQPAAISHSYKKLVVFFYARFIYLFYGSNGRSELKRMRK